MAWEGCHNARDLGGLPTAAGGVTRRGSVFRADLPGRLTAAGRRALLAAGVRTLIDLRPSWEAEKAPSLFMAPGGDPDRPTYVNLPLEAYRPEVGALIQQARGRAEVYALVLDHYPENVARVLRAVASARPGGVLIHCHAGKDRTGTVAALLLGVAGVPAAAIMADYAESQVRLWPQIMARLAAAGEAERGSFWLQPTATADVMAAMLRQLEQAYGGVEGYVRAAGLTEAEVARLRGRLL